MPRSELLNTLLDAKTPKNIRMMAARGLAPLAPSETFGMLVQLLGDTDPEVSAQARLTLRGFSEHDILDQVQAKDCPPEVLEFWGWESDSHKVLAAIIFHPLTPVRIIESLALTVPGDLLDRILDNRIRLLDSPGILTNIKLNPSAPAEILRLVEEIETEFFRDKKKSYQLSEIAPEGGPPEAVSLLQAEPVEQDLSLEGVPLDPEQREAALNTRISQMSVRQKIHHALLGTREARSILIRDSNKQVSRSVLLSPKLSENEVESYAAMRNVSEEILREIANSRQWTRNNSVIQNLIKNPKTPPFISQRFLPRLHSKQLAILTRDRGVSDVVRTGAQRILNHRSKPK